jgi:hypothetical protein
MGISQQSSADVIISGMTNVAERDDAPEFMNLVQRVTRALTVQHNLETLVVVKIDNWFGSNWLGFSGKALGTVGVHHLPDSLRIPPFVPNRVVSQRRFRAPDYEETDSGKPIHTNVESTVALLRKAATVAPNTALVWYSGNSSATGRGSVMVYLPVAGSYWSWYAGWQKQETWRLTETWNIKRDELLRLIEYENEVGVDRPAQLL